MSKIYFGAVLSGNIKPRRVTYENKDEQKNSRETMKPRR